MISQYEQQMKLSSLFLAIITTGKAFVHKPAAPRPGLFASSKKASKATHKVAATEAKDSKVESSSTLAPSSDSSIDDQVDRNPRLVINPYTDADDNAAFVELKDLAVALNPTVGLWDPLRISTEFWESEGDVSPRRGLAWFREAEIKHGRVAMAAFVGYCIQANAKFLFDWAPDLLSEGTLDVPLRPEDQWASLSEDVKGYGLLLCGLIELFGIPFDKDTGRVDDEPRAIRGYHPWFQFSKITPQRQAKEINNGRLAMLAMAAFYYAQVIPGSVPMLKTFF